MLLLLAVLLLIVIFLHAVSFYVFHIPDICHKNTTNCPDYVFIFKITNLPHLIDFTVVLHRILCHPALQHIKSRLLKRILPQAIGEMDGIHKDAVAVKESAKAHRFTFAAPQKICWLPGSQV